LKIALPALGIAAFLILVARPAAVAASLLPFQFPWREQVFVSWVGLRGAVPVVLALFPVMYGVEDARFYFNVAFFVVLVSLLLQGWTIAPAARLLSLEVPPSTEPVQRVTLDMPGHFEHEILSYQVQPGSLVAARDLATLELPDRSQVVAIMRDGAPQPLRPELELRPLDYVYLLAQPRSVTALNRLFDPHLAPDRLEEHRYFGDFVLNGDALLADLAAMYGVEVSPHDAGKTLADYLNERSHGRVVVGDRAPLGRAELVVRELQDGRVSRVGLKLR
jgi:cell volume regulation protein A